jgi:hypothetical protein
MKVTPDVCEWAQVEFELVFGDFVRSRHPAEEFRTYLMAEYLQGVAWGYENPAGEELVPLEAKLRSSGDLPHTADEEEYSFILKTRAAAEQVFIYGALWGINMARIKRWEQRQ